MSRISADLWKRLRNEHLRGDTLWARQAAPDITERLLAALDATDRRHFLVRLEEGETHLHDVRSRGVSVLTHELEGRGHQLGTYLDIICMEPSGYDAFDLIGGEIGDRISTGMESASDCVSRVLSKWRRFWDPTALNILSREAQIGLFAELWFLHIWLIPKKGAADAVVSWRGPFGSRHDFEWKTRSVEVKATVRTGIPIHRINGLDQLALPEGGDLLFFSVQMREEQGATNNLPSLVAACRADLKADEVALAQFEAALSQIGYSDAHEAEYEGLRVRIVDERLFQVRDDFPRLTVLNFPTGLPSGVSNLEYEIALGGFDHLCVARRPNDDFDL